MPLTASYPGAIKSFSEVTDGVTEMTSTDINPPYAEITAIETELGTDVAGTVTDLKTRLAKSLDGAGYLHFAAKSALTLSSGAITVTQNWHTITSETAAVDDLDTITASTIGTTDTADGFVLFLKMAVSTYAITLKHNTGNIICPGAADIVLSDNAQVVCLIYDNTNEKWLAQVSPSNAGLLNDTNTWSAINTFSTGINFAYTTSSADLTLTTAHYCVDVTTGAGNKTITLPTAVGCNGREYIIRKADAAATSAIVASDGAETINGSTDYELDAQYDTVTLMSTGAAWIVV